MRPHLDRGAGPGFFVRYSRTANRTTVVVVVVVVVVMARCSMGLVEPMRGGCVKSVRSEEVRG